MTNQEQQPAPPTLGAVLSIVQAVIGLVPRWLVVAVGLVVLAWLGLELYQKAQQMPIQTDTMESQRRQEKAKADAMTRPPVDVKLEDK